MLVITYSVALILALTCKVGATKSDEDLVEYLFQNYDKYMRPAKRPNEVVNVAFYLTLLQLISIAEKSEEMVTSQYVTFQWQDSRLAWDPSKYSGIKVLRLPPEMVWKPDIDLYNNNDGAYDKEVAVNVLLKHTGRVEWLPPAIYKSSCSIKVDYFPFDWQNCTMKFRSFTDNRDEVRLVSAYDKIVVDMEAYTDNGEWSIVHCPVKANTDPFDPAYQDLTLYLIIQRKPLFYVMNIIVPCVLISSLSVLVFYLPSHCSEKMNMSISLLLGLPVYLLLLAKRVPETSLGIPLIGSYLLFIILSVTLSVICSVLVLNVYHRNPTKFVMSPWVRDTFMEILPPLLFMKKATFQKFPSEFSNKLSTDNDFFCEKNRKSKNISSLEDKSISNQASSECCHGNFSSSYHQIPPANTQIIKTFENLSSNESSFSNMQTNSTFVCSVSESLQCEREHSNVGGRMRNKQNSNISTNTLSLSSCYHKQQEVNKRITFASLNLNTSQRQTSHKRSGIKRRRLDSKFSNGSEFYHSLPQVYSNLTCEDKRYTYRLSKLASPYDTKIINSSIKESLSSSKDAVRAQNVTKPNSPCTLCCDIKLNLNKEKYKDALNAVTFMAEHLNKEFTTKTAAQEWHYVAMVMDRLFLYIFLFIFLAGTAYFAFQALSNRVPSFPFVDNDPRYAKCLDEKSSLALKPLFAWNG